MSFLLEKLPDEFIYEFTTNTLTVRYFEILRQHFQFEALTNLRPNFFLSFDQKIDRSQILRKLTITDEHGRKLKNENFLLVDVETMRNSINNFKYRYERDDEACITFTLSEDLLKSTEYTIELPEGCSSAEGPLTSTTSWSDSFYTYRKLAIEMLEYDFDQSETKKAGKPWFIRFNNPLDPASINNSILQIEPEIDQLSKNWTHSHLIVIPCLRFILFRH